VKTRDLANLASDGGTRPFSRGRLVVWVLVWAAIIAFLLYLRSFSVSWEGFELPTFRSSGGPGADTETEALAPAIEAPSEGSLPAAAGDPRFTIAIAPITVITTDASATPTLESLYPALLAELRTIANIDIVELDMPIAGLDVVRPLAEPRLREDLTEFLGDDADLYFEPTAQYGAGGAGSWSFSIRYTYVRGGGGRGTLGRPARGDGPPDIPLLARQVVDQFRQVVFPPDLNALTDLRLRVLDAGISEEERVDAFERVSRAALTARSAYGGDLPADFERELDDVVASLLNQSADAEVRYRVLSRMVRADAPELIPAVVDALLYDDTDFVRLEAVHVLAREFGEDPSVQAALRFAAENDSMAEVRTHAEWAVLDDTRRRALLAETLGNRDLSDRERLALVIEDVSDFESYLDAPLISSMIEIASRTSDSDFTPVLAHTLSEADPGVVVPALLDRLRFDPDEAVRAAAATALTAHVEFEGVREALQLAASSDPSPQVRQAVPGAR
jgi:HEAT repeat protein